MDKKRLLAYFSGRYIAGDDTHMALNIVWGLSGFGIKATIDNLGESVSDYEEACDSVREYCALLDDIRAGEPGETRGPIIDTTISMKLTHMGLDISDELALANARTIVKRAGELNNFVRLDMENSPYTERTVSLFLELFEDYKNVGIAIQSCLMRSEDDIAMMNEVGASVRLCKGAYKEPSDIAFKRKKDVDMNFETLMKELLLNGNRPAIATHDERLIEKAKVFARENDIGKDRFEFQMLLGIKRSLQKSLVAEGYTMRVYVPYGANWLPYILRRFRERKENIWFVVKNIFD